MMTREGGTGVNTTKALAVTRQPEIVKQLEAIFHKHEIDLDVVEEWSLSFADRSIYTYYLIDQELIDPSHPPKPPARGYLIGLIRERNFEDLRRWIQWGADDVVVIPSEWELLSEYLQKTKQQLTENSHPFYPGNPDQANGLGQVLAFYSAKGGSGTTLLSTLAAQCLQVQLDQRVILIDLNAQFGGLEVVFGLEPHRSYDDLQPVLQELSINHIFNVSQKDAETGVQILLGPANPVRAEQIPEELVSRMIRVCRAHFDYVILDLPSSLNRISFTGLHEASSIYYLLTPDSLSLRAFKHAWRVFQRFQLGLHNHTHLVLNRKHKKAELTEQDIARLIDLPIAGSIRSDFFAIQPLLNMGKPFFRKKKEKGSKVMQDIRQLLDKQQGFDRVVGRIRSQSGFMKSAETFFAEKN